MGVKSEEFDNGVEDGEGVDLVEVKAEEGEARESGEEGEATESCRCAICFEGTQLIAERGGWSNMSASGWER